MGSITAHTRSSDRSPLRRLLPGCAVWLLAATAGAEPAPPATPEILAAGVAELVVEGRSAATVATALVADGPRFALAPIADALGVDLRVGPLGDSHTLIFEDRQIIVGPGQSTMVTVAPDGKTKRDFIRLTHKPIRYADRLMLPLEVLSSAVGEPLNYYFTWNVDERRLEVSRPETRLLQGAVNLRHQYQVSLVEIEFSEAPRYRVERFSPGQAGGESPQRGTNGESPRMGTSAESASALEIQLIGDRLQTPIRSPQEADPLVKRIIVAPDRLRLELAAGAVADQPRLLLHPRVRLVIEVFAGAGSLPVPASGETSLASAGEAPRRAPRRSPGIRTIALDPGHGGTETGAVGPGGSAEADLALLIARAMRLRLERRLPVRVILTRTEDVDVALETRTAIANENQADLFISLHFNSSFGPRPRGAETYFLSREASDQLAAAVAAAENDAATPDDDPELDLQMILWDLAQSYHLTESQRFATLVQEELNLALGLRDRGVKQAPFTVLMGAKMPAVLVELGFLSNPEEEEKLASPVYRTELVDALVRAVGRFKRQIEDRDVADRNAGSSAGEDRSGASGEGIP